MLDSKIKAAEFTRGLPWINVTEPLSLEQHLKGKIVLLDFWTFCCSDCLHILPYLRNLEEKYAEFLVVVGVHSAKFDNEGIEANIRKAVSKYAIEHPVVCDRGFSMWEKYFIREWPTLVLIDPDGNVVERIACSQNPYGKFEQAIEQLIAEYSSTGKLKSGPLPQIAVNAETVLGVLRFPGKVQVSPDGKQLFVSDTGHNRILICNLDGTVCDTIGSGLAGADNGDFNGATFRNPQGVAIAGEHLYIADTDNHMIRLADLANRTVKTIAGTGKQRGYERNSILGSPLSTALSSPWDLALHNDQLFIAMAGSHQIWCYDTRRDSIEIYAGTGRESLVDGQRLNSQLSQTSGLAIHDHNLYFADSETSSIRVLDLKEGIVDTLVGEGLFAFGDNDGTGKEVKLQHPLGIAAYKDQLLIADSYNHRIKILTPPARSVRSIAGTGKAGNLTGSEPGFSEPGGIAVYGDFLFIADTNNHAIKKLNLLSGACEEILIKEHSAPAPAYLPDCTEISLPALNLKADSKIIAEFKINMVDDLHLNEEMPISVHLTAKPESLILLNNEVKSTPYQIKLESKSAIPSTQLELSITCYYCAGAGCFIKSFKLKTTCTLSPTGDSRFQFNLNFSDR